jgi:small subunit ribosomal protein S4
MSRYVGPRVKILRQLGTYQKRSLIPAELPGLTPKKPKITDQNLKTRGSQRKNSKSQYLKRLQEKQKLRWNYGISERQLVNYFKKAKRAEGPTGEILLRSLEMRLDCIVFRVGLAPTIASARQMISHGHIWVNHRCLNKPNYGFQSDDFIEWRPRKKTKTQGIFEGKQKDSGGSSSASRPPYLEANQESDQAASFVVPNQNGSYQIPDYVKEITNKRSNSGNESTAFLIQRLIRRNELRLAIQELFIVEFYSR